MPHTRSTQRLRPVLSLAAYRPVRDLILHEVPVVEEPALEGEVDDRPLLSFESWSYPRRILLDDEQMAIVRDDHELKDAPRQGSLDQLVELLAERVSALLEEKNNLPNIPRGQQAPINLRGGAPATTERVLVDATEAAAMLGISVNAVRLRTQRGQMPAGSVLRTGRRVQYKAEALRALRPYTKRSP